MGIATLRRKINGGNLAHRVNDSYVGIAFEGSARVVSDVLRFGKYALMGSGAVCSSFVGVEQLADSIVNYISRDWNRDLELGQQYSKRTRLYRLHQFSGTNNFRRVSALKVLGEKLDDDYQKLTYALSSSTSEVPEKLLYHLLSQPEISCTVPLMLEKVL